MNTGTPDGGGLGFLLKLLLPAEYRVNGFILVIEPQAFALLLLSLYKPTPLERMGSLVYVFGR